MTFFSQLNIVRSFYLVIAFLFMSEFLIAQDQCISMNSVYSNQDRTDNLLHGDFNGDNIQDLVLVPKSNTGSIRIMHGSSSGLILKDSIVLSSYYHVSSPGEVNGDDYDDLLISVGNKILVYKGGIGGLAPDGNYTIDINELIGIPGANARGYAEGYVDQNKNGKREIIITAGTAINFGDLGGFLIVIEISAGKIDIIKSYTGEEFESFLNTPIKVIGDMNGDGYEDFLLYKYYAFIEIFYGGPDYFTPNTKGHISEYFNEVPAFNNVGDVNKDGYNDLLLTKAQWKQYEKSAWLFLGSPNGLLESSWATGSDLRNFIYYGIGFNSGPVGDVNGDGYSDFYISGGELTNSLIYFGSSDISQIKPGARFGISPYQLVNAGDLNGDGNVDYASGFINPVTNLSEIGIINGSAKGMSVVSCLPSGLPIALTFNAKFGQGAGDTNKDGYDDIVLGHDYIDEQDGGGKIMVIAGAPVGIGTGGMEYYGGLFNGFGDQYGSGDFNGDGFSDVIAGDYSNRRIIVFYGSVNGISKLPSLSLNEVDHSTGWGEEIEDVGDINGDGYDDFLSFKRDDMLLILGSSSGPQIYSGWSFISRRAFKAGDANKDGFTDFFLKVTEGYRLFYGSATGPTMSSFISALPVIFGGDINGDGYDDMLTTDNTNKSIGVLFGTPTGYTEQRNIIQNAFSPNGIGDFNGDGYDDIGVSNSSDEEQFPESPWRVDIYLGSASGIQPTVLTTIRAEKKYQNLVAQPRVGDFNSDGFEDLLLGAGFDALLVYGIKGIPNINCPADAIFYSDSSCIALVNGLNPPGDPALYKYRVTGTTSFEGNGSINGKHLYTGEYSVTYSLLNDNSRFCTFRIKVLDTLANELIVPNRVILCSISTSEINIPSLKIKDSCQIETITYRLTGATIRNGTGVNASGFLNYGETIITWTVTDSSGNTSMIDMKVSLLNTNFNVKIPKAYQINAQQSQANTIFLGYLNNTIRLTAYEPNSAKHHYRWTNGDTTRYTYVRHNVPGRFKYSVFVTNDYGCRDRADVFVKVVENRCPNSDNIYMCYNGSTVCVSPTQVPTMVANGARLGKCGVVYESDDLITAKEDENSIGTLILTASPNPTSHEFNLKIDGTKGKPYTVRILNSIGTSVFVKQGITENTVRAGASFQKGVYFAEVLCGKERRMIKLLKLR